MYLRPNRRYKDGKQHRYWSIVESKRCAGGRVVQRPVLYLGEINHSRHQAWCRAIEAFDEDAHQSTQIALFPADRSVPDHARHYGVQVRLAEMQLHRPRQWGACWLACQLYAQLGLDRFWTARLPDSREGTSWRHILQTLVCYRLIDPGSEWRLHRHWFEHSAMADLLAEDFALVEKNALYRCLDKLLEHKQALFSHLQQQWKDLFGARFEVLLYDLTSTYFESNPPADDEDKRRHGYSRDKRSDCVQVVIALVVTPDGFPFAYEVLAGNTSDKTTLRAFLAEIEAQYGKAQRIWVMDRGIPTEDVLAEMRAGDPPVSYLVGTPKGRLTRQETALMGLPWHKVRPGVDVKLLAQGDELYVLVCSHARTNKERAMRRRQLKWLWARLAELSKMQLTREELLMRLGAARAKARAGWRLVKVEVAAAEPAKTDAGKAKMDKARVDKAQVDKAQVDKAQVDKAQVDKSKEVDSEPDKSKVDKFKISKSKTIKSAVDNSKAAKSKATKSDKTETTASFTYALDRQKLRQIRRREGRYLLRTNLSDRDPTDLWRFSIQLTEIEAAFKNLKHDLKLRPIFHQLEQRIEAHIFVAFLAYCLHVTLRARLGPLAPGLTPRAVLDKPAAIQMLDVHFQTTDGRTLVLTRHTEPTADHKLLLQQLGLTLPPQPPRASPPSSNRPAKSKPPCSGDLCPVLADIADDFRRSHPQLAKTG